MYHLLFLAVIVLSCEGAKQLPCNDHTTQHIDRLISKINPIGNADVEFPENIADAKKYCQWVDSLYTV